ncbi:autotransporter-associated beta strand repeat-containing protein (plasmid) [Cereibacter azotoformans]|uniref:autotransporter outer membrane beta-barrel domain-containing protein n=1 Tax=Cereibacter azotoformans TaxID=43057 RepID=UPI001EEA6034|nr:autotransporter outer membrane beta-barrel domain-containing protein [Cereibacter azotoformans]ULB12071.1 autotransporter-associated beta strand repeat-containing protein [Cereibacter azotoformans]
MRKTNPAWWAAGFCLFAPLATPAAAGHLFTQSSSNKPTWISEGKGILIQQYGTESAWSSGGNIEMYFEQPPTVPEGADTSSANWWQWSVGDVMKITIPTDADTVILTIGYDTAGTDGCAYSYCGITGSSFFSFGGITALQNLSLKDHSGQRYDGNYTESDVYFPWSIQSLAGEFSLGGYRIYTSDGTINGTGSGPLDQNSVIDEDDIDVGGGGPKPITGDDNYDTDLGTDLAYVFDGGTLNSSTEVGSDFTLTGNGGTIRVAEGDQASFTGVIADDDPAAPGRLTKTGDGRLELTGTNSYSGGTSVTGGTLAIASDAALGAAEGDLTLDGGTLETTADVTSGRDILLGAAGGTLDVTAGHETVLAGTVADAADGTPGALTKTGDGRLELTGTNSYSGGTSVTGGTLAIAADAALGAAEGDLTLDGGTLETAADVTSGRDILLGAAGGTLDVTAGHETVLAGTVADAADGTPGALTKTGDGRLELTGTNSYSGGTSVTGGTLAIASDAALGAAEGDLTLDGGTLETMADVTSGRDILLGAAGGTLDVTAGHETVLAGTVADAADGTPGALTKAGDGRLELTGTNSYSGGTSVTGGTLAIASDAALGAAEGDLTLDGGTLETMADVTSGRDILLGAAGGTLDVTAGHETVLAGTVADAADGTPGALTKAGDGRLELTGTNSYSGGTSVTGGTLAIAADAALGAAEGDLTLDGGTLETAADVTSGRDILLGAAGGTLDVTAGHETVLAGTVADAADGTPGALTKTGDGRLELTGTNSYSGGTSVTGGTLAIASDAALGAAEGDLTLDGGTLEATGNMTLARTLLVGEAGGTLEVGGSRTVRATGILAGSGDLAKTGSGSFLFSGMGLHTGALSILEGTFGTSGILSAGSISVASGARLDTSNRVAADIEVAGTLAVNEAVSTLTLTRNMTLQESATLELDIDGRTFSTEGGAGSYDRIDVVGLDAVFLAAGRLVPMLRNIAGAATNSFTALIGDSFRIVTTANENGISGAFSEIVTPAEGLAANSRFALVYGSDYIDLVVTADSFERLAMPFGNRNGTAAGAAVDMMRDGDPGFDSTELLYGLYGLDTAQTARALAQLSGEIHAFALSDLRKADRVAAERLTAGAQGLRPDGRNAWVDVSGLSFEADGSARASGSSSDSTLVWLGLDLLSAGNATLGLALGQSKGDLDAGLSGDASRTTDSLALYGFGLAGRLSYDVSLMASRSDIEGDRTVTLGTGVQSNSFDAEMISVQASGRIGYRMDFPDQTAVMPWIGAEVNWMRADTYEEEGSAVTGLSIENEHVRTTTLKAGADFSGRFGSGDRAIWGASLGVRHLVGEDAVASRRVSLDGAYWTVSEPGEDRTSGFASISLGYAPSPNSRIWTNVGTVRSSGDEQTYGSVGFNLQW